MQPKNVLHVMACLAMLVASVGAVSPLRASEPMSPPATLTPRDFRLLHSLSVFYNLTVWPAGKTISVCFFPDYPEHRQLLVDAARKWEAVASIFFDFGAPPHYKTCAADLPSDIRVQFSGQLMGVLAGSSRIGTTSLERRPSEATLRIATRSIYTGGDRRQELLAGTMLHEVGHALGLAHEHQHSNSDCMSEHLLSAICSQKPPAGTAADKFFEIARARARLYNSLQRHLDPLPASLAEYDVHSIMHYRFRPQYLKSGKESSCFSARPRDLSDGDRRRAAILYPKDAVEQARFIKAQIEIFRRTLVALQVSKATAERLASGVQGIVRRRHGDRATIPTADLEFSDADTSVLEQKLAFPQQAALPDACKTQTPTRPKSADAPNSTR